MIQICTCGHTRSAHFHNFIAGTACKVKDCDCARFFEQREPKPSEAELAWRPYVQGTEIVDLKRQLTEANARTERLENALHVINQCVDNVGCYCADPPEDHEPPEDPDDWQAHSQYCPYYLQGYIADILATHGTKRSAE